MPLKTTVIGSYPKPDYLAVPSWFETNDHTDMLSRHGKFLSEKKATPEFSDQFERAVKEVLSEQAELGIDVVTDGELDRESYVWYLCRNMKGFSFENLEVCTYRDGACTSVLPQVVGQIGAGRACDAIIKQWTFAQANSSMPVKATIPGPLTIMDSTKNKFYSDEKQLSRDLVVVINKIFTGLVEAGCRHIQLDEPLFVREVERCLDFGIDHASRCIEGLGNEVTKTIHLCCGYPNYLDQTDYHKADPQGYFHIADKIDQAGFDEISIEDTHRRNDLSLLAHFKRSKVILGSVTIASSKVEPVTEIRDRLKSALNYIPSDRLGVAPDCGLGFLPREIMRQKLKNMAEAAKSLP
ncbi:5-methyltetrahydropteroyltriglutamate--homocysteine methyltransferase-like [Patiria miniata]|uniref:Cobalamin-independent methionine synthase MetE C-terminal/archaeal domain-containing protein n=1 Tax=Patiria miniata TaxID=46514 RepID=A0A914A411_PATMI|nr:5-methyltetrahydropteroyltriglutamate--homocysteine methyltransferase-like [Patiria miniata]